MAHLSYVYPYPAQGYADRPSHEDPVADVAVRGLRSVTELYSEAVAPLRLAGRRSELRIFTGHRPALDEVQASVTVDPPLDFEVAYLQVPTSFADRAAPARASALLDVVHQVVLRLAEARGWDVAALERCRQHALDAGLEYQWSSAPKASPDRRLQARAVFRLPPDGYGRVRLEVSRREDGALVATSDEALAFCTSPGFRRAAASLRWRGSALVEMVPYDWGRAFRGGELRLRSTGDAWASEVEDYCEVRPVPAGDPAAPPLSVLVTGIGASAAEQPWDAYFVGGGPIESRGVERYQALLAAELRDLTRVDGVAWWSEQGQLRLLEVEAYYRPGEPQVRARRTGNRLRVVVERPPASVVGADLPRLAREDALAVIALVRRRTGLGPHPRIGNAET